MNEKKTFSSGMNVGSSSILVTFVLLCLVTFAALSFVSAKADYNLAVQTAERITNYYSADTSAEVYLANIDSLLSKLADESDKDTYYNNIEGVFSDNDIYSVIKSGDDTFIHYEMKVSDSQCLNVTVKVLYPEDDSDSTFCITQWENVTTYVPANETIEDEKGGLLF